MRAGEYSSQTSRALDVYVFAQRRKKKTYLKILNYWEMLLIHLFLSGFANPIQGFKPTPSSQRLTYTPLTSLLPGSFGDPL